MAHVRQQIQQQQLNLVARSRIAAARHPHSSFRGLVRCNAQRLPSIREFIQTECPVKGLDGQLREQARAATLTASVIAVDQGALVVPGERRLFDVPEQQLEQIIADKGQVIICCFEPSDSSSSSSRRLAAPRKGSWACLGSVAGLQRLPGSSRALVRVQVADRVVVQALDSSNPAVTNAQAALLRDRWAYFVRAAALEQHLAAADGTAPAGSDVAGAISQVQDAAAELLQVLQQLADTVAAVADAQQGSSLQQLLVQHEAADELQELLAWCQLQGMLDGARPAADSSSTGSVALDSDLLEKAWRLSFAPFAVKGLTQALSKSSSSSSSSSASSSSSSSSSSSPEEGNRAVLEMTDLGLRLEEALETAASMRATLATQLAMNSL